MWQHECVVTKGIRVQVTLADRLRLHLLLLRHTGRLKHQTSRRKGWGEGGGKKEGRRRTARANDDLDLLNFLSR